MSLRWQRTAANACQWSGVRTHRIHTLVFENALEMPTFRVCVACLDQLHGLRNCVRRRRRRSNFHVGREANCRQEVPRPPTPITPTTTLSRAAALPLQTVSAYRDAQATLMLRSDRLL